MVQKLALLLVALAPFFASGLPNPEPAAPTTSTTLRVDVYTSAGCLSSTLGGLMAYELTPGQCMSIPPIPNLPETPALSFREPTFNGPAGCKLQIFSQNNCGGNSQDFPALGDGVCRNIGIVLEDSSTLPTGGVGVGGFSAKLMC
ncbi:hypothetical protein Q9189_006179 [Teloschistes chrysophthalmus]